MALDLATNFVTNIAHLAGVPGLGAAAALIQSTATGLENVKVHKQQCSETRGRCLSLMVALKDGSEGLEGTRVVEIADEIETIMQRLNRKLKEWGSMNQLRSFLAQREIKDGIDSLNRDIDEANMRFSILMNMEIARVQIHSKALQERDKAEIRELLQQIVRSQDDMRMLLNMQPSRDSHPVEEVMEGLQTELMDPSLNRTEEEVFKAGLWELHKKTDKLPPLTDLTGQVDIEQQVARGRFNDVFSGWWLDKERVALRLPRTIADSPDDQRDFQREVALWRGLIHENVTPLYGVIYQNGHLYSVSPWMENGLVSDYLKKNPNVDRLKLLTDAAMGLEYLHQEQIVHGDVKGANLLISENGTARLSGFGLSTFLEECGKDKGNTINTNPRWCAPELLRQTGSVSKYSDIWSFGMLCLEVLSGQPPYAKFNLDVSVLREVDNGKLPDHPGRVAAQYGLSDQMWRVMQKCWNLRPDARPSIVEVKNALLAVRGCMKPPQEIKPPEGMASSKVFRIFSRPSQRSKTADSAKTGTASLSSRSPVGTFPSGIVEDEIPSPIDISTGGTSHAYSNSVAHQSRRHYSVSSMPTPSIHVDHQMPTPSPAMDIRSVSASAPPKRADTLSVPQSSSLPTSFGTHLWSRQGSVDSQHGKSSPIKSVLSSDSSHLSGPARGAVTDPQMIVNLNEAGMVASGTLEGFVQRLITHTSRKDAEFRDVLFAACADFTTPEDLFGVLSRRFFELESDDTQHTEDRVALQYNIFSVIMYWLSNRNLPVDQQLLWQMKGFCETAMRMKTSATMHYKASDLLHLIESRKAFNPPLAPGRVKLSAKQISPERLAIALALLEGDMYKALVPADYIAHLRRHSGYNNLEALYTANNKIAYWVKDSILHYEEATDRTDVLKFFIHTANHCLRRRNFSSLMAIASALHSAPIDRLKQTKDGLEPELKKRLKFFESITDPSSNHRGYRDALNKADTPQERDQCIPWLAIHLKELHLVLQRFPATVEVDGRPMINFERYVMFMDRVREVAHYTPPNLEPYRSSGYLDYLEMQLRNVTITHDSDDQMMTKSRLLEAREVIDHRTRRRQLRQLGFRNIR